jgi:hypothetical protein
VPHHFKLGDASQDNCIGREQDYEVVGVITTDRKMCYIIIVEEASVLQILKPELAKCFALVERLDSMRTSAFTTISTIIMILP